MRNSPRFFQPKKIHLTTEFFSVENDLLTPTFKSRRPQIAAHFAPQLQTMYKDLDWERRTCVSVVANPTRPTNESSTFPHHPSPPPLLLFH